MRELVNWPGISRLGLSLMHASSPEELTGGSEALMNCQYLSNWGVPLHTLGLAGTPPVVPGLRNGELKRLLNICLSKKYTMSGMKLEGET